MAGVWCRDRHSRPRRPPRAEALHVARGWGLRFCPTCGEPPGSGCIAPSGRPSASVHVARLRREPAERLRAAGEGPRAVHQLLAGEGALSAGEIAHALYGPEAPARRVTNQLHALRRRGLALKDRSTRRWESVDV